MNDNPLVCEHGQLRRKCYICELESERAEDALVMRQALAALERGRPQIIGVLVQQDQDDAIAAIRKRL